MPAPMLGLQGGIPSDVRERIQRNWAMLPADVQDRLTRAGYAPKAPEPAGTRADLAATLKSGAQGAMRVAPELALGVAAPMLAGPLGLATTGIRGLMAAAALAGGGTVAGRALGQGEVPTLKEGAIAFAEGAAGEGLARAPLGIARRLIGPGAEGAAETLAAGSRAGVPLSAGEFSTPARMAQAGIGKTITGAGTQEALNTAQNRALEGFIQRELAGNTSVSAAGQAVQQESLPALRQLKRVGRVKYQQAATAADALGIRVPIPNDLTKRAADAIAELDQSGLPAAQSGRLRGVLEGIATEPKPALTYRELERLETDLREVAPSYAQQGQATTMSRGMLESLQGQLGGMLDDAVKGTPAETLRGAAKDFWRDEVIPLRQAVGAVRGRNVTPDQVVNLTVRAGRPDRLATLFRNLPEETTSGLREAWFTKALEESKDQASGEFTPIKFLRQWSKLHPSTKQLLAGDRQAAADAERLLQAVAQRQSMTGNPSRTAYGLGSLIQAGTGFDAARRLYQGDYAEAGAESAALFGPPMLGKILATKGAARLAAMGLTAGPGSSAGRRALDELARVLAGTAARTAAQTGTQAAGDAYQGQP